ncbi:hypothetical protein [Tenacibaculum aiptasiae]|uniref:hypothetical protein n=1 Tax=Tenacibaculum aiptasiae TaxID=426481 RepID=UPI00232CFEFD|nr:hypothetical protein [Tenacibaculum aiptasiae]
MGLLYKEPKEVKYAVFIETFPNGVINLHFTSDSGKFGTDEILAEYNLTPKRLLEILNDRDDYKEDEL